MILLLSLLLSARSLVVCGKGVVAAVVVAVVVAVMVVMGGAGAATEALDVKEAVVEVGTGGVAVFLDRFAGEEFTTELSKAFLRFSVAVLADGVEMAVLVASPFELALCLDLLEPEIPRHYSTCRTLQAFQP